MDLRSRLFSFLFAVFLFGNLNASVIGGNSVVRPASLSDVELCHDDDGFTVLRDGVVSKVRVECIDKELRGISEKELPFLLGLKAMFKVRGHEYEFTRMAPSFPINAFTRNVEMVTLNGEEANDILMGLTQDNYIRIFQYSDGEYGLHLMPRVRGGGGLGAVIGAWTGTIVTNVVAQVVIITISTGVGLVGGPVAGAATWKGLTVATAPLVQSTATALALAGGIAGGVITGPV